MRIKLAYTVKAVFHRLTSIYKFREYSSDPRFQESIAKIRAMHNLHYGERCFIIGNGPSLNQTNLSKLRNEFTFGLNRIYLLFPQIGFSTSYFVINNRLVMEQFRHEIVRDVPAPKFTSWENFDLAGDIPEMYFLFRHNGAGFYGDLSKGHWGGATVTYAAIQIAYHMGFTTVYLVGVDHSFASKGKPNETIVSQGDDANHFDPNYFGKGVRWQLPDLETSEYAYQLARQAFEKSDRQILDATINGKLEIFKKIDYSSIFL